jgi:hypothetical protein
MMQESGSTHASDNDQRSPTHTYQHNPHRLAKKQNNRNDAKNKVTKDAYRAYSFTAACTTFCAPSPVWRE